MSCQVFVHKANMDTLFFGSGTVRDVARGNHTICMSMLELPVVGMTLFMSLLHKNSVFKYTAGKFQNTLHSTLENKRSLCARLLIDESTQRCDS